MGPALATEIVDVTATDAGDGPIVWLVLPTYNEASNLEPVVAAARERLPERRRVLVVDDSSPDGTGTIADRLATTYPDVSVMHRSRRRGGGAPHVGGGCGGAPRGGGFL